MELILGQLHEDHRNFTKLLIILERQIGALESDGQMNHELVDLTLRYLLEYPDSQHHPYEDALYKVLAVQNPKLARGIRNVEIDHIELNALTRILASLIDNIVHGVDPPRGQVIDTGRELVQSYRRHIEMEEAEFLPVVANSLDRMDWKSLMRIMMDGADPLFGDRDRERYRELRRSILSLDKDGS